MSLAARTPTPPPVHDRGMRLLWQIARPQRTLLIVALALSIATAVLTVLQPQYLQRAVNGLVAGGATSSVLVLLGALTVAAALVGGAQTYVTQRAAESAVLDLRRRMVGRLVRGTVESHDRQNSADLLSRTVNDTNLVKLMVSAGLIPVTGALVTLVGIVGFMIALDPLLVVVTLAVVIFALVVVVLVGRPARENSLQVQESTGAFTVAVERMLAGIRTVKAFGAEDVEERGIAVRSREMWRANLRLAKLIALVQPSVNLVMQASLVIVIIVGAARVAAGPLDLGGLLAYTMYMVLMVMPISTLSQAYTQIQVGRGALIRLNELDRIEADDPGDGSREIVATTADQTRPHIEFRRVGFGYDPTQPVLTDIDFVIGKGERVAIVGRSGSGKTSLIELLEKFYEPDSGEILVNGTPLESMGTRQLRSTIGYMPQHPSALTGTLRENLSMGRLHVPDRDLLEVLAKVGLRDLADRSTDGLDADLGQSGATLSGGQAQRLAWARVLLSGNELVVLDEPTSSLDPRTEDAMLKLLADYARERTVVTVTHRPDAIVGADRVIVVDDGRVATYTSYDELVTDWPHLASPVPGKALAEDAV